MNKTTCILIYSCMVQMIITVTVTENIKSKENAKKDENDDIFVDDEDLEGSGHGKNKYDLESSGSGYGPYDEGAERSLVPNGLDKNLEKKKPVTYSSSTAKSITTPSTLVPITEHHFEVVNVEPVDTKVIPSKNDFGTITGTKKSIDDVHQEDNSATVYKDKTISFFAQPGILVAIIGGAVVGLLCAILVVMFIVYRMRKKDEGSYALEEMKKCLPTNPYVKPNHREFFA